MISRLTAPAPAPVAPPSAVKVVVAGGFGVGKSMFVSVASDIDAVTTDVVLTPTGTASDDGAGLDKASTTAGLDFGRVCLPGWPVLYVFGTPGQQRFWPMWHTATDGAVGAVVLVDTRRLEGCFAAIDYFEQRAVPFVVAANRFDTAPAYSAPVLREALTVGAQVPVLSCDARQRPDVTRVLVALAEHVLPAPSVS